MFYVVQFPAEKTVAVVPENWLKMVKGKQKSYWPPKEHKNKSQQAKSSRTPRSDWSLHDVIIMTKCASYDDALSKSITAQFQSDLSSLEDHTQHSSSSSSDGDDEDDDEDNNVRGRSSLVPPSAKDHGFKKQRDNIGKGKTSSSIHTHKRHYQEDRMPGQSSGEKTAPKPKKGKRKDAESGKKKRCEDKERNWITPHRPHTSLSTSALLPQVTPQFPQSTPTISTLAKDCREMLSLLLKIDARQRRQTEELQEIRESLAGGSQQQSEYDGWTPRLPLQTVAELDELESHLAQAPELALWLRKIVNSVGGKQLTTVTTNSIRRIMTDSVAIKYSRAGKSDKLNFSALKLYDILRDSLINHYTKFSATEQDVASAVSNTLKHVRDPDRRPQPKISYKSSETCPDDDDEDNEDDGGRSDHDHEIYQENHHESSSSSDDSDERDDGDDN